MWDLNGGSSFEWFKETQHFTCALFKMLNNIDNDYLEQSDCINLLSSTLSRSSRTERFLHADKDILHHVI